MIIRPQDSVPEVEGVSSEAITHINGCDLRQVIGFGVEDLELMLVDVEGLDHTDTAD